jgi:hypothetical protein
VLLNEALHVFPGCLTLTLWVRTVSVLALGLGVAWSVRAGPSGSLPSAGSWFASWCGVVAVVRPGVGLPGVGVCRGCPGEKIPQEGHDGDLLPGASLVFLTFWLPWWLAFCGL